MKYPSTAPSRHRRGSKGSRTRATFATTRPPVATERPSVFSPHNRTHNQEIIDVARTRQVSPYIGFSDRKKNSIKLNHNNSSLSRSGCLLEWSSEFSSCLLPPPTVTFREFNISPLKKDKSGRCQLYQESTRRELVSLSL